MMLEKYLKEVGFHRIPEVKMNLSRAKLLEEALSNDEGRFANNGALVVLTGKRTGRSPKDRYIVQEKNTADEIDWGEVNIPISEDKFDHLFKKALSYLENRKVYLQDVLVGKDARYQLSLRVLSERAWGALFAQTLFVRKKDQGIFDQPDFVMVHVPGMKCDPEKDGIRSEVAVILHLSRKIVLIIGTGYAGEMKKSMFSVMNYLLPFKQVFPMHCSANVGSDGDVALFFGLSGTGKTSLSADPQRKLIGDDEHGWSPEGVFNFEGGCYAKVIRLREDKEPQIYHAIRFGSIAENVIMDPVTREIDYDDDSITENTRATYPVEFIDNALNSGMAGHPKTILFLTADAYGVFPPIAKLTAEMAMYYFLSGYTSKLAGTETGVTEPQATFSACFGAPFLPLHPLRYAEMLREKMQQHRTSVWLVNTGWIGGPYGIGKRIDIAYTREMVRAAIDGKLDSIPMHPHPVFKVLIPDSCPGVPSELLHPENTWENEADYWKQANKLAELFQENFKKFGQMPDEVLYAGPVIRK